MNAQHRKAHCASSLCIWQKKKKHNQTHKFLKFVKQDHTREPISPGFCFVQVLLSHNFVALHHWLLLLCYLQSQLKFRNTSAWEQEKWESGMVLQPERLCVSKQGSHNLFSSHSGVVAHAQMLCDTFWWSQDITLRPHYFDSCMNINLPTHVDLL